ncbi:6973_t:CDS:2 [Entrophospora sp. SA101]|nr:6973_t:CDS:2 [Entrophospora sp. SA101]
MSYKKRAEALTFPKSNRPQTGEEMSSMLSYRDSGILLLSLTQSRQAWTSSILKKFSSKNEIFFKPDLPENTNSNAVVTLLGKFTLTIGPHTFYDTKFYKAIYEKENIEIQSNVTTQLTSPQTGPQILPNSVSHAISHPIMQTVPQAKNQHTIQLPRQTTQYMSQPNTQSSSQQVQPSIQPRISQSSSSTQSQAQIQPLQSRVPLSRLPSRQIQPVTINTPTVTSLSTTPLPSIMTSSSQSTKIPSQASLNTNSFVGSSSTLTSGIQRLNTGFPITPFMQTVIDSVNPNQILAIQEHLRNPESSSNITPEQRSALINQLSIVYQLLTSQTMLNNQHIHQRQQSAHLPQFQQQQSSSQMHQTQSINQRSFYPVISPRQIVRCEVLLEFKENKHDKWLFPKDAILEATTMSEPHDVITSFYLPQNDDKMGSSKDCQAVTIQMTQLTQLMLDSLQEATNDISIVYKSMTEKIKHQSKRAYLNYRLPVDYPEDLLDIIGQRESNKDMIDRETVGQSEPKNKRVKASKSSEGRASAKSSTTQKKSRSIPEFNIPVLQTSSSTTSGGNKRCAYCYCKSTPMWRRGPDGAGTLCNACGVKWKQGKILQSSNNMHTSEINDSQSTTSQHYKSRKDSFPTSGSSSITAAAATSTSNISSIKSKKKPGRSFSLSEGATDEDEGREKIRSNFGLQKNNSAFSKTSASSSKKAATFKASTVSTVSTILGGELADSPANTSSSDLINSPKKSPQSFPQGILSHNSRNFNNPSVSFEYPISLTLNSIAFGPGNAYFSHSNCSVTIHENFLKINLSKEGYERTTIDIWKESMETVNFNHEEDKNTGVILLVWKTLAAQYLTRFDQELLNPDRYETVVIFKFVNMAVNIQANTDFDNSSSSTNTNDQKDLRTFLENWLASSLAV